MRLILTSIVLGTLFVVAASCAGLLLAAAVLVLLWIDAHFPAYGVPIVAVLSVMGFVSLCVYSQLTEHKVIAQPRRAMKTLR